MRLVKKHIGAILIVLIAISPTASWAESAGNLVSDFQSGLISVMKDAESLGVKGRYERLEPVIKKTFHLALMAGLSAGPYWQQATTEQRNRLVDAFTGMSIATLATLFSGYSGEKFVTTGERPGPQGVTFVDTALKIPGRDSDVTISYVAREFDGQWRLIDVIVDGGISELKVRISEYRQTLNKGGVEALINLLRSKTNDLLS
jgi:phospholipid transport system substrate-binding protein